MLIGQLAQRTGFSRDTIRFYEKEGLIEVPRKARRANNYKEYPDEVLDRLLSIKRIKAMGFTLNETREVLDLVDLDRADCGTIAQRVADKVRDVHAKIKELKALTHQLERSVRDCPTVCTPIAVVRCGLV